MKEEAVCTETCYVSCNILHGVTIRQALCVPIMAHCNSVVLDSEPTDRQTQTNVHKILSSVTVSVIVSVVSAVGVSVDRHDGRT